MKAKKILSVLLSAAMALSLLATAALAADEPPEGMPPDGIGDPGGPGGAPSILTLEDPK